MDEILIKDCYEETISIIYSDNIHTANKDVFVKALICIESGCSFNAGEYSISISTSNNFIDIRDTDLIKECVINYLEEYISNILFIGIQPENMAGELTKNVKSSGNKLIKILMDKKTQSIEKLK